MGREVRRVPPDWKHPKWTQEQWREANKRGPWDPDADHPLFDETYREAGYTWLARTIEYAAGLYDSMPDDGHESYPFLWDWDGQPPTRGYYREREWTAEEATAYQIYET